MKILLIQPAFPDTFWGFKHAIEFVAKKVCNPPLGLLTVAALLPKDWQKRLVDLNIELLTDDSILWADMIFIGAMNVQRKSAIAIIERCKGLKKTIVAGGPLFTGEHSQFELVDHFILNEAEITLPQFLNDLETGTLRRVYETSEYADITQTPAPLWDLLNFNNYDSMNVQFSRGCPFNCDFCNVTALLGHRPRIKSADQLITELDGLYQRGWRRNIFLVDDNFIGNKKILKQEILPRLIQWRKGKKGCLFLTEASINLSDDPELVDLMVKAGFVSVFIGIETSDEESLAECNKKQNQKRDLLASVKMLQNAGLQVMAGFIVGFDSDTPQTFQRQIDFIQKSGIVTAMVGLLQAPYGTDLYRRMEKEGRLIKEMSGDNTDGSTNIIPRMNYDTLMSGYNNILQTIYSPEYFYARIKTLLKEFNPANNPVTIEPNEILALLKAIWRMGILGPERPHFWKLFFWMLFNRPGLFPIGITLTVYGYHFRVISTQTFKQTLGQKSIFVKSPRKSLQHSAAD